MSDFFSVLALPRRPWLEAEAVKQAFHRLSATLHPDVAGTGDAERFATLNAAHAALREPAPRLRHFLELVAPGPLSGNAAPPSELGDLFMQIAGLRRRLDALLVQRKSASSALSRALLAENEAALCGDFENAGEQLAALESAALDELRRADAAWVDTGFADAAALAALAQRLMYLSRWNAQVREALFVLER